MFFYPWIPGMACCFGYFPLFVTLSNEHAYTEVFISKPENKI
jgi:hypothetical protein